MFPSQKSLTFASGGIVSDFSDVIEDFIMEFTMDASQLIKYAGSLVFFISNDVPSCLENGDCKNGNEMVKDTNFGFVFEAGPSSTAQLISYNSLMDKQATIEAGNGEELKFRFKYGRNCLLTLEYSANGGWNKCLEQPAPVKNTQNTRAKVFGIGAQCSIPANVRISKVDVELNGKKISSEISETPNELTENVQKEISDLVIKHDELLTSSAADRVAAVANGLAALAVKFDSKQQMGETLQLEKTARKVKETCEEIKGFEEFMYDIIFEVDHNGAVADEFGVIRTPHIIDQEALFLSLALVAFIGIGIYLYYKLSNEKKYKRF